MLSGIPTVFGINPLDTSSTPKHDLGTYGYTADGRLFRYAKAGGTGLSQGQLQIMADLAGNHDDCATNTASKGDTTVTVTLGATAVVANEYDGGYMVVNDDTGEGTTYRIESVPASSGSEDVVVVLKDALWENFGAGTTVTLVRNPYYGILVSDGTQTDTALGVPIVDVTANYYCWIQTKGICSVLADTGAQPSGGSPITIGDTSTGGVEARNAAGEPYLGMGLKGITYTSGEYEPVLLQID